jgi:hypothetical protein
MDAIVIVTGTGTGSIFGVSLVTQDTCPHDAKVKVAEYDGMYECTRRHKFIRTVMPKQKENRENDETAPDYLEKE